MNGWQAVYVISDYQNCIEAFQQQKFDLSQLVVQRC